MILVKLFLLSIFVQIIQAADVKTSKCGKYLIKALGNELDYTSHNETSEPLQIKIEKHTEEKKVLVGFFTASDKTIHCVAVKFFKGNEMGEIALFKNSVRVMERIEQMPKEQRAHLIEMIDAGKTTPYGERILIMELGVESFHDRLYNRTAVQYESERDMLKAVKLLAQPLVEFHQIAVHMDVNPQNYLYVLQNDLLVLKLIDFEGAKYVTGSNKNRCVEHSTVHAFSPEYTGPEYYGEKAKEEISTKFDIWSVGIIVFEIMLDHLRAEQQLEPLEETERTRKLLAIDNLFLGFTRNRFGIPGIVKESQIEFSAGGDWLEHHQNPIETVLQLWQKFPRTALLVTNLLNLERRKRLTAQGILNFIEGLCQIGEFKEVRNSKNLRIFNSTKFGELLMSLRVAKWRNKINILKVNRAEMKKGSKKIKKMLKKVIKAQQTEIKRMKRQGTAQISDCETE